MNKKALSTLLKLVISLGLIGYLLYGLQRSQGDTLEKLRSEPKNWSMLALAWALAFTSAIITFVRWYFLVRALGLPFRLRDGLRLGFLGYMFNFISLGAFGGDLFKAVFLAREQPGRRTEAVSTIVVDRLLGLYGLLLVGTLAIFSGSLDVKSSDAKVHTLVVVTLVATGVTTLLLSVMMLPTSVFGPVSRGLNSLPKVGHLIPDLLRAAKTYRQRHGVLWAMLAVTMVVHLLNISAFYCMARGLPGPLPTLADHFLIIPLGLIASAIPLPMAALGAFELVMKFLYAAVAPPKMDPNLGLLVALANRIITILVALVGVFFYLGGRREVKEMIHEAEELEAEVEAEGN